MAPQLSNSQAQPTPDSGATDIKALAHVLNVTRASGTSFYWGMRLLSRPRREAMFAIYAFCREVDDIADGVEPETEKIARLMEWRTEIDRVFERRPETLTGRALMAPVLAFELRRENFRAIIDGMEMDVRTVMQAPSMAELQLYCARVAGAVGLLSIRAFGTKSEDAERFALALGEALQLTNILRDLRQDAALGRLYLPREHLLAHEISSRAPQEVLSHPRLPEACSDTAELAEQKFRIAAAAVTDRDRDALRPAIVMMRNYQLILDRLRRAGWRDLDQPVRVSKPAKLWIAFRYGVL